MADAEILHGEINLDMTSRLDLDGGDARGVDDLAQTG